jgi:putative redox protein
MDDSILSLGGLRLSAHLALPPPPGRAQGLVVCHGFPNGPRGAATVGTTYADLADRLARDSGFVVLAFNFRGTGTSEGDFSVRGWMHDLRAAVRTLAERPDVRGVWTVGFGHGATFALCEAVNDDLVRGVASIAARSSLGDWVRDPGGLVTEAREMGMIRTAGYPPDVSAWGRELQLLDADHAVRRLGDRPLLILHGVDDIDVPVDEARAMAAAAGPNTEVRLVSGAGHHLRHDPRALATLLGWLDRQA